MVYLVRTLAWLETLGNAVIIFGCVALPLVKAPPLIWPSLGKSGRVHHIALSLVRVSTTAASRHSPLSYEPEDLAVMLMC